jgi:hypothetical protein
MCFWTNAAIHDETVDLAVKFFAGHLSAHEPRYAFGPGGGWSRSQFGAGRFLYNRETQLP